MSPLWRDEVAIALAPRRLALARRARGLKSRVIASTELALLAQDPGDVGPVLARLVEVLSEPAWQRARARVSVADHLWARFCVVPWSATRLDAAGRFAQARFLLGDAWGEAVLDWSVALSDTPPGRPSIACAVPATLRAAVEDALAPARLELVSLQPKLVASFDRWRRKLPADDAWFVNVDDGALSAVELRQGGWDRIHLTRPSPDWRVELERLQSLAALTRTAGGRKTIFVAGAARPAGDADAAEIVWLEEGDASARREAVSQRVRARSRPRPVRLDFVAVRRTPNAGTALLLAGLAAAVWLAIAFNRQLAERSRLDAALGALSEPRVSAPGAEKPAGAAEAANAERDLAIPWSRLLADLDAASKDSADRVSLLAIEPDPGKQLLRITAEVRSLPDAFAYLERLQKSEVLRHPLLESHERRKDSAQHPVRIKLSAEWRT